VIGVNPATDSVETVSTILVALNRLIEPYEIPTQACCLAHLTTQLAALDRCAPVDLLFQSVAGTESANRGFGITLVCCEGREQVQEHHLHRDVSWAGDNVMYFETGRAALCLPRRASWSRSTYARSKRLRCCTGFPAFPRQQCRWRHWARIFVRRETNHSIWA
jgi:ethanolamine ammonia-lyase large subunit